MLDTSTIRGAREARLEQERAVEEAAILEKVKEEAKKETTTSSDTVEDVDKKQKEDDKKRSGPRVEHPNVLFSLIQRFNLVILNPVLLPRLRSRRGSPLS